MSVLLRNSIDNIVQFGQRLLIISSQYHAHSCIHTILMYVERAETNIAQIGLAAVVTHIVIVLSVDVSLPSRRLVSILKIFI